MAALAQLGCEAPCEPLAGGYVEGDISPGNFIWAERGGIETAVNVGNEEFYEIVVELKD